MRTMAPRDCNGLLLRADLHRLFDTGYVTVTPQLRLEVGRRLRDDYRNGRSYYPLHGATVQVPAVALHQPERAFLEWHNERRSAVDDGLVGAEFSICRQIMT